MLRCSCSRTGVFQNPLLRHRSFDTALLSTQETNRSLIPPWQLCWMPEVTTCSGKVSSAWGVVGVAAGILIEITYPRVLRGTFQHCEPQVLQLLQALCVYRTCAGLHNWLIRNCPESSLVVQHVQTTALMQGQATQSDTVQSQLYRRMHVTHKVAFHCFFSAARLSRVQTPAQTRTERYRKGTLRRMQP